MSGSDSDSPLARYQRLKNSCVRAPAPAMARFSVTGRDAEAYLHRRLSQTIKGLPPGKGVHALQLGGDGRMECDLLVYRSKEGFEILTGAEHAETAAAITEKFTLMDDVTVVQRWDCESLIALLGPGAPAAAVDLAAGGAQPFHDPRWKSPLIHVSVPREAAGGLEQRFGRPIDPEVFEFARIEEGIPRFGVDTDSQTIPLEAGLTDAIDFEKGCFPGQEVLAKLRNLGHPARQFVRLELEGEHRIGAGAVISVGESADGANVGAVTSSATIPVLGRTLALGFVKWPWREATEARIETGASPVPARMERLFEWKETGFKTRP